MKKPNMSLSVFLNVFRHQNMPMLTPVLKKLLQFFRVNSRIKTIIFNFS